MSSNAVMTDVGRADKNDTRHNEPLTLLRLMPERDNAVDVCVAGAGPTGLMLSALLTRFGIRVEVLDERANRTTVGRADGIQPKTIETLQMLRLGDDLVRTGTKVFDICMWRASEQTPLHRESREEHYPTSIVDVLHPYILLCHQGMVEDLLVEDLAQRDVTVQRGHQFVGYSAPGQGPLDVHCRWNVTRDDKTVRASFLVGCDGAHSRVRESIPGAAATSRAGGESVSVWGVLDGQLDTDFSDIWSKTVVFSEAHGSILIIPRERNMTRLYIEMKPEGGGGRLDAHALGQDYVMARARQILAPYTIEWLSVEWFGRYTVAQRVAARFADERLRAFIAGDASHTHSPKAAQGMNTGLHDAWNLAWKLNLAVRGLARPALLASYGLERGKIAHDLIDFDYAHANQIAQGDAAALAANFHTNMGFISGVGVNYAENALNRPATTAAVPPGHTLPPAKATRYVDANVVDMQLDIPVLGQFRVYVFIDHIAAEPQAAFLAAFSDAVLDSTSALAQLSDAAKASYEAQPRRDGKEDIFFRPERYTTVSDLFTFALITSTDKKDFELRSLPPLLSKSRWTVYLDNVPQLDTQGKKCADKWVGALAPGEAVVLSVRPDGYVGAVRRWTAGASSGAEAAQWLERYYGGFLQVPISRHR